MRCKFVYKELSVVKILKMPGLAKSVTEKFSLQFVEIIFSSHKQ